MTKTNQVRFYRRAWGLSQAELADRIDVTIPTVRKIEQGNTNFSFSIALRLMKALEADFYELWPNR